MKINQKIISAIFIIIILGISGCAKNYTSDSSLLKNESSVHNEISTEQKTSQLNLSYDDAYEKFSKCINSNSQSKTILSQYENANAAVNGILKKCDSDKNKLESTLYELLLHTSDKDAKKDVIKRSVAESINSLIEKDVRKIITTNYSLINKQEESGIKERLYKRSMAVIDDYGYCLRNGVDNSYRLNATATEVALSVMAGCEDYVIKYAKYRYEEETYNDRLIENQARKSGINSNSLNLRKYSYDMAAEESKKMKETFFQSVVKRILERRDEANNKNQSPKPVDQFDKNKPVRISI